MDPDVTRELIERLASVLGVTTAHVYQTYVSYQRALAVVDPIAVAVFWLVLLGVGTAIVRWTWHQIHTSDDLDTAGFWLACGVGMAILLGWADFWLTSAIEKAVLRATVPDYYAIDELLKALRGGK